MTDIFVSRSQVPLYRKSGARLEQTEQQDDGLELHDILRPQTFVNGVSGTNGSKIRLYCLSASAFPVCVPFVSTCLLNPVPQGRPASGRHSS